MSFDVREPEGLLILPHLRIQNANAISGPLTHGFPSMTAFVGFMWAVDRRMADAGIPLRLEKIGVICHWHEEQTQDGYVKTFHLTRNPINKDGGMSAIVEEGRIHLDVTLVLQVSGVESSAGDNVLFHSDETQRRAVAWQVRDLIGTTRIAGGTVLPATPQPGRRVTPDLFAWPEDEDAQHRNFRALRRRWLPGFALVDRPDILQRRLDQLRQQASNATVLDAWMDLSRFNYRSHADHQGRVTWTHDRPPGMGWIVPIPIGYDALSDLYEGGQVVNARDDRTPFRFVESVYSIGQWISPHRLSDVGNLLWWGEFRNGLYRCRNGYVPSEDETEIPGLLPLSPMTAESV